MFIFVYYKEMPRNKSRSKTNKSKRTKRMSKKEYSDTMKQLKDAGLMIGIAALKKSRKEGKI